MAIIGVDGMPLVNKCTNSYHREKFERAHYGAGTLGQEKRYMHINVHTHTHIYIMMKSEQKKQQQISRGWGWWERTYTYIRWFITNLQETPRVDAKRNKVLLVSSADRSCWYRSIWIYIYYEFSLLHIFSLVLQPWMSAYIRKTDGVYISVPQND